MDLLDTIRTRRSLRAFQDEPISRQTLHEVLAYASNAPSAMNLQPWEVHVVLGEERKRLSHRLLQSYRERLITCGPGSMTPLPDRFIDRAKQCSEGMRPLVRRMGTDFKTYINEGSLDFYGAPAAILVFLDECFPLERMTDIGSFLAF